MKNNFVIRVGFLEMALLAEEDCVRPPRVAILYHYMHPDDVVSAHHFDGVAEDLAGQGWSVEALPCNRGCREEGRTYSSREVHKGVLYRRVWRPKFRQASFMGRLANAVWMIVAWSRLGFRRRIYRPDAVLVGTDPVFAVIVAIPLKVLAPKIKVVHWCFDMHPEAALASGVLQSSSLSVRLMQAIIRWAYNRCDIIADLGPCMRRRLRVYGHRAHEVELTPWALGEYPEPVKADPDTRRELFGDASLALLYSGNFGEAHSFEELLRLARLLRTEPGIHFCFAVRGNRSHALKEAVTEEDHNVSFAGFASLAELEKRLGSADIHMASLRPEWSGIAVPSKFFGSLAAGRPVVFAGGGDSGVAEWIRRYEVGWHLAPDGVEEVAHVLRELARNPSSLREIQEHCHCIYQNHFSRKRMTREWDDLLRLHTERTVRSHHARSSERKPLGSEE
ncbi:glycosyltransferase family 4 protein [Thiohalorhabdus sp. Cl-TMA]|uniref:Glycosyltransferase family 4 protein n=1 Tax=Thiohalorhabdus methylotrophus TaxID=3242694 RepID=A0ABV4U2R5_9GAMM